MKYPYPLKKHDGGGLKLVFETTENYIEEAKKILEYSVNDTQVVIAIQPVDDDIYRKGA